jgi:hypothetical protein
MQDELSNLLKEKRRFIEEILNPIKGNGPVKKKKARKCGRFENFW